MTRGENPLEPVGAQRWSCRLGAVGSASPDDYVLGAEELRWYGFPELAPLGGSSPEGPARVFGLDCEMVLTTAGPELARVSLVELVAGDRRWPAGLGGEAWAPEVLLDAFVRPEHPVVDLLTAFSGVTAADLEGASLTLADARRRLAALVGQGDILCGHGLAGDLLALRASHARVIDTLVLYPHNDGPPSKRSLESLALEHLKRRIQVPTHASVEDATAALDLVRLRVESRQGRVVWAPIPDDEPRAAGEPTLASILARLRLDPGDVRCVYLRGSRSVGYAGSRGDGTVSDWDFVIVLAYRGVPQSDIHLSHDDVDAALYDEHTFLRLVQDCCIWALECIFAPPSSILAEAIDYRDAFARHREATPRDALHANLRRSVSYEAGRQWNKARRYLAQKGGHACRKRMFIALRFVCYGIDVARHGVIPDIRAHNHLWQRLQDDPAASWSELRRNHAPLFHELREAFRRAAPKLPRYGGPRLGFQVGGPRATREAPLSAPLVPVAVLRDAPRETRLATTRLLHALAPGDPIAALSALRQQLQIGVRQHPRAPGVVQLRYTPQSPREHPVVRECRGLILDAARGWELLAYPFDRFFNLSEGGPGSFDWSTARVYPKLDGSLAILYRHEGQWRVASSRRPDAGGLVGARGPDGGLLFHDLFWNIWRQSGYALPPESEARRCFLFEMTSWRHPILVRHDDERLTLIGARDLDTLEELDPAAVASDRGWETLRPLDPAMFEGDARVPLAERLQEAARRLDVSLHEGFVACDASFRRVKLKSPDYVRMTWLFPLCATRGSLGRRRLLEVIRAGEVDEFLAYCPEHRAALVEVQEAYDGLVDAVDEAHAALHGLRDGKDFALAARRYPFASALFARRKEPGLSSREALLRASSRRIERWLNGRAKHGRESPG